jgi:hypothetical protein
MEDERDIEPIRGWSLETDMRGTSIPETGIQARSTNEGIIDIKNRKKTRRMEACITSKSL